MDTNGSEEYYGNSSDAKHREYRMINLHSSGDNEENDTNSSTGRWTDEEHEAFLQGLRIHGRNWKQVATFIPSRTIVQIRTHAQKYFAKLTKAGIPFDERGSIDSTTTNTDTFPTVSGSIHTSSTSSVHFSGLGSNGNPAAFVSSSVTSSVNEFLSSTGTLISTVPSQSVSSSSVSKSLVNVHNSSHNNTFRSSSHAVGSSTLSTNKRDKHLRNYPINGESIQQQQPLPSKPFYYTTDDGQIVSPSLYTTTTGSSGTDEDYSDTNHPYHPYHDASIDESENDDDHDSDSDNDDDDNNDDEDILRPMEQQKNHRLLFSSSHPNYGESLLLNTTSTSHLNHHDGDTNTNTNAMVRVKVRRGSGNTSIASVSEVVQLQDIDTSILLENESVGDLDFGDRLMVFSDTSAPPTPILTSMNSSNNRLQRLSGSPILGPTSPLSISGRKRSGSGFTNINNLTTHTSNISTTASTSPRLPLSSLNPPTARLVRSLSGPSATSVSTSVNGTIRLPTLTKQHSLSKLTSIDTSHSAVPFVSSSSSSSNSFALPPSSLGTSSFFSSTPPTLGLTNETGILSSKASSTLTTSFRFLNESSGNHHHASRSTSPDLGRNQLTHSNDLMDDLAITTNNNVSQDISLPSFSMMSSFGISTLDNPTLSIASTSSQLDNSLLDAAIIRSSSLLEADHQHDETSHLMMDNEKLGLSLPSTPSGGRHLPLVPPPTQQRYDNGTETNENSKLQITVSTGVPMNKLATALSRLPRNDNPAEVVNRNGVNTIASSSLSYVSLHPYTDHHHPSSAQQESNTSSSRSTRSPTTSHSVSPVNSHPNRSTDNHPLSVATITACTTGSDNTVRSRSKSSSGASADLSSSSSSPSRYTSQTTVYSSTNNTVHSTTASDDGEENSFGGSSDNHTSSLSLASGGLSHRSSFDGSSPRRNNTMNNLNLSHSRISQRYGSGIVKDATFTSSSVPVTSTDQLVPGSVHVPPPLSSSSPSLPSNAYRVGNVRIAAIVTTQIYSPLVTELADEGLERLAYTNNTLLQQAMAANRSQPFAPSQCTLVTRTIMDNVSKQSATTVSIIPTVNLKDEQRKDSTIVPFNGTGICVGAVPVQLPHGPIQFVRVPIPEHLQPQVPDNCKTDSGNNSYGTEEKDSMKIPSVVRNGRKDEEKFTASVPGSKPHGNWNNYGAPKTVNVFDPDAFFS